jgi:hypothetical protein
MVHRNFEQTEEMVNNLIETSSKLGDLEQMLLDDSDNILGPAPNLLRIHYQINRLEAFRNQTMHQAKQSSKEVRATLTRYFDRLNRLIAAFDEYILSLCRNILPIVRAGHPDVIVKLLKIVEIEGKEDQKARIQISSSWCTIKYLTGYSSKARQESRENGCRLQVPLNASQRARDQALSFQTTEMHRRIHRG